MVDGGRPYVVPVNFSYQDSVFYIHGSKTGRKIALIKANPWVFIEIDLPGALIPDEAGRACDYGFG